MKKYNIIYADPPWSYGSKSALNNTREITRPLGDHYETMTLSEMERIGIINFLHNDAACFMWATDSHLDEALKLMSAWGFKYKTIAFNWIKVTSKGNFCRNIAPWTMKSSEVCLLGTRGAMSKFKKSNNVNSLVIAQRTKHSKKPEEVRDKINALFGDLPRIELFAREKSEGWDVWGNEVESDIEL